MERPGRSGAEARLESAERFESGRHPERVGTLELPVDRRDVEVGEVEVVLRPEMPAVEESGHDVGRVGVGRVRAGEKEVERLTACRRARCQLGAREWPCLDRQADSGEVGADHVRAAQRRRLVRDVDHSSTAAKVARGEPSRSPEIRPTEWIDVLLDEPGHGGRQELVGEAPTEIALAKDLGTVQREVDGAAQGWVLTEQRPLGVQRQEDRAERRPHEEPRAVDSVAIREPLDLLPRRRRPQPAPEEDVIVGPLLDCPYVRVRRTSDRHDDPVGPPGTRSPVVRIASEDDLATGVARRHVVGTGARQLVDPKGIRGEAHRYGTRPWHSQPREEIPGPASQADRQGRAVCRRAHYVGRIGTGVRRLHEWVPDSPDRSREVRCGQRPTVAEPRAWTNGEDVGSAVPGHAGQARRQLRPRHTLRPDHRHQAGAGRGDHRHGDMLLCARRVERLDVLDADDTQDVRIRGWATQDGIRSYRHESERRADGDDGEPNRTARRTHSNEFTRH